jgi:hypothetical protein
VIELSDTIFVLRQGVVTQTFTRGVELDDVVLAMARG